MELFEDQHESLLSEWMVESSEWPHFLPSIQPILNYATSRVSRVSYDTR